jgi:DNA repair protein RadD
VKAIIIDEAHLGTQSGSDITSFIKEAGIQNVLGLTATPVYLKGGINGAELKMMTRVRGAMFKDIAHVTQISELVINKYWTKLLYTIEELDESLLELNSNSSDYTLESQKKYYTGNELEEKIISYVDRLQRDGRKSILIFVPSIEEAVSLSELIPGSRTVHSKITPKERDEIVSGFRNMKINVVVNVNILSVGFDHPQLDAIITARTTASMAIYYQQIGRGVRIFPGKKNCRVVDVSGNFKTFGKVEELNFEKIPGWGWGLFAGDKLITNYPMAAKKRPTKDSLAKGVERKRKEVFDVKRYSPDTPVVIWFGKHKGKGLQEVNKGFPSYLPWIIDNFKFDSDKKIVLKKQIELILNL